MGETILLVDDEEGIRKFLGISLKDLGYTVHVASDAAEALDLFAAFKPTIVLTDIKMPGMDGIELLQRLKRQDPEIEVIMISGHGDMDLAIKSLKYEAADFVTKPIKDEILEAALGRVEEKIRMRRQLKEYTERLEDLVREKSARLVELERRLAVGQVVEGLACAMRDITEDVQGAAGYFNEMPCFVSIHDRELTVVAANQLYKEKLGDRVGGKSCEAYVGPAADPERCPVGRTLATGKGQRCRETIRNKAGQEIPVIVHTAPISSREHPVELVLEIAVDVTEVKRLQEELRTTQQKYQELFNEAPCSIAILDRELKVIETNRRFQEELGDAVGAICHRAYRRRESPCPDCPAQKTFQDGQTHQIEEVVVGKGGQPLNALIWTAPVLDAEGKIAAVMEMITNITPIRKLQDHLTSLGLLLGSVSHGVKGMLTALDGGIYRLESGLAKSDPARVDEARHVIKDMVGRIRKMVLDILYYAKSRSLNWERVDVAALAEQVASTVEPKAARTKVGFTRELAEGLGEFEVDAAAFAPALVNILENAVDACADDKAKTGHAVAFAVRRKGSDVLFEVRDNGMGMDEETRQKLFTLFFSSKGSRGTGLGLFIANQVVEQHGGSISVQSEPGSGSRFTIRMPATLPESAKAPAAPTR